MTEENMEVWAPTHRLISWVDGQTLWSSEQLMVKRGHELWYWDDGPDENSSNFTIHELYGTEFPPPTLDFFLKLWYLLTCVEQNDW